MSGVKKDVNYEAFWMFIRKASFDGTFFCLIMIEGRYIRVSICLL